jgi:hypothetical protein
MYASNQETTSIWIAGGIALGCALSLTAGITGVVAIATILAANGFEDGFEEVTSDPEIISAADDHQTMGVN